MPVTILARKASECAWPVSEPSGETPMLFCGAPVLPGGFAPYCPEHHKVAYLPSPALGVRVEAALSRLNTHAGRPWELLRFLEPAE